MPATHTPPSPEQPQITAGLELLGSAYLGDLKVDLYGMVTFVGSRISDFSLEDVALANTQISLESVVTTKQWERLAQDAYDAYTKALAYVPTFGGRGVWRAA